VTDHSLTTIVDELVPLARRASLSSWDVNVVASAETEQRRIEAEIAITDYLSDAGRLEAIRRMRPAARDSLDRRQLDLLANWFVPHQVPEALRRRIIELETSVESDYARHRSVVGGRELDDNAIKRILKTSESSEERRAAWEASKTIGSVVAERVRELARLRNEAARTLGFRDWFALAIGTMEMDEARLFATLDETEELTREPFQQWKDGVDRSIAARFGLTQSEIRPWHYDDPFFQEVPGTGGVDLDRVFASADVVDLAVRTLAAMGLETAAIVARSDLFPREGKCQHAFCLDIDRAGDIRVLANVVPDRYWAETMLHELGHAVHGAGYDPSLPWLLRDSHLVITEAVAILMGRLASDPGWLALMTRVDGHAAELAPALAAFVAADLVVFARWSLVMTHFERALYADPEADLDAIWWSLVERLQLVTPPDGRRAPDWAAKIHVACSPVYYHTYLYGNLIASQLQAMLAREAGGIVGRPAAGRILAERVFAPGESLRWDRLVEAATGEPLNAEAFAAQIHQGISAHPPG
jgi:peptidyl-dipeptidase A